MHTNVWWRTSGSRHFTLLQIIIFWTWIITRCTRPSIQEFYTLFQDCLVDYVRYGKLFLLGNGHVKVVLLVMAQVSCPFFPAFDGWKEDLICPVEILNSIHDIWHFYLHTCSTARYMSRSMILFQPWYSPSVPHVCYVLLQRRQHETPHTKTPKQFPSLSCYNSDQAKAGYPRFNSRSITEQRTQFYFVSRSFWVRIPAVLTPVSRSFTQHWPPWNTYSWESIVKNPKNSTESTSSNRHGKYTGRSLINQNAVVYFTLQ